MRSVRAGRDERRAGVSCSMPGWKRIERTARLASLPRDAHAPRVRGAHCGNARQRETRHVDIFRCLDPGTSPDPRDEVDRDPMTIRQKIVRNRSTSPRRPTGRVSAYIYHTLWYTVMWGDRFLDLSSASSGRVILALASWQSTYEAFHAKWTVLLLSIKTDAGGFGVEFYDVRLNARSLLR